MIQSDKERLFDKLHENQRHSRIFYIRHNISRISCVRPCSAQTIPTPQKKFKTILKLDGVGVLLITHPTQTSPTTSSKTKQNNVTPDT